MDEAIDLLVIGGGVNGAGIARDAAGRGLSVVLAEKDDLAQGTSSRSSKMIHGGLRYLEYYEFRLVREALNERTVLLRSAPHIIRPIRIVIPQSPGDRPAWMVRIGLFIYDHLGGGGALPGTAVADLRRDPEGDAVSEAWGKAFLYSDCAVDDARLVVLAARDAAGRGAEVLTRTRVTRARAEGGLWRATLEDGSGRGREVRARALVNAAGPWAMQVIEEVCGTRSNRAIQLVKGSHIVVRKCWEGPHGYLFQNADRRVIFALPWVDDLAMIGTTDIVYHDAPEAVAVEGTEVDYLLEAVNRYFRTPLSRADIVTEWSGVRPLFDDGKGNPSAVTRDYVLDLERGAGAPLLNVFGGKITTFRELSERALEKLAPVLPGMGAPWTASETLPGGDLPGGDPEAFAADLVRRHPALPAALLDRLARSYGSLAEAVLGGASSTDGLGRHFGDTLWEAEVRYLMDHEWARTAEDVLTRRSKLYLRLDETQAAGLGEWMKSAAQVADAR